MHFKRTHKAIEELEERVIRFDSVNIDGGGERGEWETPFILAQKIFIHYVCKKVWAKARVAALWSCVCALVASSISLLLSNVRNHPYTDLILSALVAWQAIILVFVAYPYMLHWYYRGKESLLGCELHSCGEFSNGEKYNIKMLSEFEKVFGVHLINASIEHVSTTIERLRRDYNEGLISHSDYRLAYFLGYKFFELPISYQEE